LANTDTDVPRHLTICECRPPWREDFGPDWTGFPVARLHYTKATGLWTLYWRDQNEKYHRYAARKPWNQYRDLGARFPRASVGGPLSVPSFADSTSGRTRPVC